MRGKVLKRMVMLMMFYCKTTLEDDALYNVALYKPACQSSVFNGWGADNGNDGRKSGIARDGIHTMLDNNNWWRVDLMDNYVISSIILTNR